MAIIKAFNGVRYAKENITNEICPPYDVISPNQKEELKKKSQYNMVKLELSDSQGTKNKYEQASVLFKEWLSKGVLLKEDN